LTVTSAAELPRDPYNFFGLVTETFERKSDCLDGCHLCFGYQSGALRPGGLTRLIKRPV
jgi:hypothetical protein